MFICARLIREKPSKAKAVLITGCDSGFGKALALRCVAKGFTTYAACLTQKGCDELTAQVRQHEVESRGEIKGRGGEYNMNMA
jgi:NAD(P)-dependent dehydrogenase (short-subunit alcohol dehydrogenase family)